MHLHFKFQGGFIFKKNLTSLTYSAHIFIIYVKTKEAVEEVSGNSFSSDSRNSCRISEPNDYTNKNASWSKKIKRTRSHLPRGMRASQQACTRVLIAQTEETVSVALFHISISNWKNIFIVKKCTLNDLNDLLRFFYENKILIVKANTAGRSSSRMEEIPKKYWSLSNCAFWVRI